LNCDAGAGAGAKTPVLLIHGTFTTSAWWTPTYARALPTAGYPVCTVDVPDFEAGDVQTSVEFVVSAIRAVAARAQRPMAVIGHSQGAFLATVALRFWPDLATDVKDFIGLAGLYEHGSALGTPVCAIACPASAWQLRPGSRLLQAYASRPLYRGPVYTAISTAFDEIVVPQPEAGRLSGARNIVLQDICPGRIVDHALITADAVAYALVLDALNHHHPAHTNNAVCSQGLLPGADPVDLAAQLAQATLGLAAFAGQPVGAEAPVRCPFDRRCPRHRLRPGLAMRAAAGRAVRVTGVVVLPAGALDQCSGTVRLLLRRAASPLSVRHVAPDCRFAAEFGQRRRRSRGPLIVAASFSGTRELRAVRVVVAVRH
jgi:pimeloyl-ACP methyl ester carboxylesterase